MLLTIAELCPFVHLCRYFMYKYLGNAAFVRVPSSNLSKNIITQTPNKTIAHAIGNDIDLICVKTVLHIQFAIQLPIYNRHMGKEYTLW